MGVVPSGPGYHSKEGLLDVSEVEAPVSTCDNGARVRVEEHVPAMRCTAAVATSLHELEPLTVSHLPEPAFDCDVVGNAHRTQLIGP